MKIKILLAACGIFLATNINADSIVKVGLEPFPPLITEVGGGYSINMLKEIEKVSDLKFKIRLMPYSRAKKELMSGDVDLIGHTPYGKEVKEFYEFAHEIDWHIETSCDIFSMDKDNLTGEKYKTKKIGTPFGNADFFSETFNIPRKNLAEGNLKNLVKMMETKRIDIILFQRASVMSTIKDLKIENVYYRSIDAIDAGFATRNDAAGTALRMKLVHSIDKINQKKVFGKYFKYMQFPKTGIVSIK